MATIGFDGSRLSVSERTGTENYSAEILRHLAAIAGDDQIVVYLNAPPDSAESARRRLVPTIPDGTRTSVRSIPLPRLWTHARLSWELSRRPPDVLFVPAHVVPLRHPPTVVTIHDLGYLVEPDAHPPADRVLLDLTTRWSVRVARRVIAISEATRQALIGAYRIPDEKIRVVRHGVSPRFRRVDPAEVARVSARYHLPERYVLTVGTIQPRKNLPRLVAAMDHVRAFGLPHRLVIAGKRGWLADRVAAEIAAAGPGRMPLMLGYVANDDLPALYSGADAFVLPSRYEGFGMPLLEALACGTPALVSDRGALPEVAGDAALVVPATDSRAIGVGLTRLLGDQSLRSRQIDAGIARVGAFSWDRTARETLAVLQEVVREARTR